MRRLVQVPLNIFLRRSNNTRSTLYTNLIRQPYRAMATTSASLNDLKKEHPSKPKTTTSAPEIVAVLRQLQVENRVQTGDEDFPECSPAWFNKAVGAIDHRFCTISKHTQSLFSTFVKDQRKYYRENTIALIPGTKGSGRTTLLHMLATCFDYDGSDCTNVKSLYLSDAIVYDATDPRLSFGDSSFIKLQYRVLHAATGAPPHAFGTTVLALRRRLGLEAWFAFPNDVLFEAVREALAMYARDYLLVAVDEVRTPDGQEGRYPIYLPPTVDLSFSQKQCPHNTPTSTNTIEDLRRLRYSGSTFILAVTTSNFDGIHHPDWYGERAHLLTIPPPNPNPRVEATCESLGLGPHSRRSQEVRYMLRNAAVHARFLADTYHQICGGGLTSVADFDAQFNAFVSPRIDQFLTYCREKHLDPMRLFDDIFLARPGSSIIDPLTVAADALGLCTLMGVCVSSMTKQHQKQKETKKKENEESEQHAVYIHPKVFVMLHSAVVVSSSSFLSKQKSHKKRARDDRVDVVNNDTVNINAVSKTVVSQEEDTPLCDNRPVRSDFLTPPLQQLHSILLALAHRSNAFTALETTAAFETTKGAAPPQSAAQCPLHFQSDVALLMLIANLARAADDASRCIGHITLAHLLPGYQNHIPEEALKDAMVRRMDPAHTSYADMLASHTLAQGNGPLLPEGMPRAVYSFPRVDDACGLLADPSTAPALLRSMAAHGLICGALHGLDVRWDVNRQVRGSLTFGLQAIAAASEVERTAAAIAEHRARRAEWARAFERQEKNPHEKTAAACDLLRTNIFVHVFVVDGQNEKRLHYTPEPFTVGDAQCFELMISMADLQQRWPMAARISALDGRDGCSNTEAIRELPVVIEGDNDEDEDDDDDDD